MRGWDKKERHHESPRAATDRQALQINLGFDSYVQIRIMFGTSTKDRPGANGPKLGIARAVRVSDRRAQFRSQLGRFSHGRARVLAAGNQDG